MNNQTSHLINLLGTESGNAWIDFMDYAHEVLGSIITRRGAPTEEAIKQSIIGKAGFKSWKSMIEAPVTDGGLGWNISSWDLWKRSYKIVQQHPYLRDIELSASEIKTINNEVESFPTDLESFNEYRSNRMELIQSKRQNSLLNAKKVNDELSSTVSELQMKVKTLTLELGTSQSAVESLTTQLTTANTSITTLTSERDVAKSKLETANNEIAKLKKSNDGLQAKADKGSDYLSRLKLYNSLPWWKQIFKFKV